MNDDTPNPLGNGQKATLYIETLRARMDPAQYESLAHRLRKAFHLLAQGRDGTITSDDDLVFTPEMNREFTVALNILLTGKMDRAWTLNWTASPAPAACTPTPTDKESAAASSTSVGDAL